MKYIKLFSIIVFLSLVNSLLVNSQTVYYDATNFPLLGKITTETETQYERLPSYLKNNVSRPEIWRFGKNTSGLAVRFRSNSTSISTRWKLLFNQRMNHMAETGIKGLDLYAWENFKWQFVGTARPTDSLSQQVIISNMKPMEREYMLFLPLYDGITSLSIGVDSLATINGPHNNYPSAKHPIVVYGSSITQGGCASRPGMSYTNILTRWMNREFINLGFSGNGRLDYEVAEVIAKRKDAGLFILDFVPNVNTAQIIEKTGNFISIIRKENPDTPILIIESIIYPYAKFDVTTAEFLSIKNKTLRKEFEKLKDAGDKNLYYLKGEELLSKDGEGTVDGIHLTDLGFQHFAFVLFNKLKEIPL